MASTYSPLKIELMATGEKNNTWGTITNTNLGTALEEAITGTADVTFASNNVTLTLIDDNASQTARNLRLNLIGTTAGARDLIVPAIEKLYFINNTCADTITVKNTTGTGIAVPAGKSMVVFNNATNVVDGITHLTSLSLGSALPVTSGGTGTTTSTGTGSIVLNNTPTLIAPLLGTPTSGVLTNATGLPISTGVSGLGTGVATFLATPSSSNLAAAVTDETGSGALVFATSPTLVTPALGTPASGVMTNVTGLPISTGVSGLGTGVATFLGTPSSSNLAAAVTDETGSGALVFATSPTLVTPALGTPASGVMTNVTGLPISTGVSGLGTGVATFLGTPSSANLAAAVTDETGSGALVFATSPTITSASLVTPALGTPASGVMTNVTGLPISTGVSGLGTGVATFLGTPSSANLLAAVTDETGTGSLVFATSPTLVTPVLGTPASATLTNATGLPISTGVSGLGTGVATFLGTPSSANLAAAVTDETGSGSLVFATSPTLVTPNLGVPSFATLTNATGLPLTTGVTGTLPVANGGTGITSFGAGVATFLGTPSSANLAAAVTDETGSGSLVFGTSPTITSALLVTPALGTPASGVMTNVTGLPLTTGVTGTLPVANGGTGITSFGAGVATFLGTPSSANLAAAVTDETGSGSLVFATSPTLVTPTLGTPASGVMTNVTGLPLTTGVTGTLPVGNGGTGVTTSTGTGSVVLSTSPTLVTPALGTPSSATLTNATGLPIGTGVSDLGTGVATFLATPSSANLAAAVTDETGSGSLVFATSPTLVTPTLGTPASATLTNATGLPIIAGTTGTLSVARGGTGATTLTSNGVVYGNGTGAVGVTAVGATGQVLIGNTGAAPSWGAPPAAGVTSVSFGTTGLTPSTATGGVITVAGTLAVANGGTGITSFGAGVATFLGTPTSANLAAAVTDETGSGALVFATNPILVTPTLGAASATSLALAAGLVATPSLTFTGDLNTGMWSPAADIIAWSTAGTEKMRIASAGDVGIGTTNPTLGRLQVVDAAKAQGSFSGWSPLTATSDAGAILVGASATAQGILQYTPAGNTTVSLENTFNDATAQLQFRMRTAGTPVTAMTILGSGNVGIGTASPTKPLHVKDGTAGVGRSTIIAESFLGGYGAGLEAGSVLSGGGTTYLAMGKIIWDGENSWNATPSLQDAFCTIHVTQNGTLEEKMRITSAGNVGIGTIAPTQALVVRREGDVRIYVEDDNANGRGGYLRSVTGGAVTLGTTSGVRDLVFAPDNSERMRINVSGDVGIGTSAAPLGKLGIFKNSVYTSADGDAGIHILSNTAETALALGADDANNVAFVQSIQSGVSYSTRPLSLNPNGGNVGIGTIAPGSILAVNDPGTGLAFSNAASGNFNIGLLAGTGSQLAYVFQRANSDLLFGTNNTEKMRIDASGNVGIGTGSVTAVFGATVKAFNAGSGATLQLGGTTVNAYFYASEGLAFSALGNTTNHPFMFFTNDVERMRITSGGTLLLGTTTTPTSATTGVLAFGAVGTAPSAVSAGGALYVDSGGILKYRNSTGLYTVTII